MREILERAARNAGYDVKFNLFDSMGFGCLSDSSHPNGWRPWRPHIDYADTFRLMVDCGLEVDFSCANVAVRSRVGVKILIKYADHNNDKAAATRMAILRAAAGDE